MITELPYEGEWHLSKNKKFEATIVLVHHFGGSTRTLLRHVRFLNEVGFDCVSFNLKFNMTPTPEKISIGGDFRLGLRRIWADQIQDILNLVLGPKILYTFSMPGASAIEAVSDRSAYQILGMVCDSGPFLRIISGTWKLYELAYRVENKFIRALYTAMSLSMWGIHFKTSILKYFEKFPAGFRILSIRGGADHLVSHEAIEEFFRLAPQCAVEVLSLPTADHLDGLKNFSDIYRPAVEAFLKGL